MTLTCVYPRKVLGTDLDHSTIDQHGLVPSGVVIVKIKRVSAIMIKLTKRIIHVQRYAP